MEEKSPAAEANPQQWFVEWAGGKGQGESQGGLLKVEGNRNPHVMGCSPVTLPHMAGLTKLPRHARSALTRRDSLANREASDETATCDAPEFSALAAVHKLGSSSSAEEELLLLLRLGRLEMRSHGRLATRRVVCAIPS